MSTPWPPADFESEGNPGAAAPELVPFPLPDLSADAFLPAEPGAFDGAADDLPVRWDALEPMPLEPVPLEPMPLEPLSLEPLALEPLSLEPLSLEPLTYEPLTYEPLTSEPAASEPAAFEPATYEPAAFEPAAFEPAPFEPAAFEPAPFEPAFGAGIALAPTLEAPPTVPSLIDDLQRLCRRLLGRDEMATTVAREALAASLTPQHPNGDTAVSFAAAIRRCIELPLPDEARIPYHQHRARLRRDLGRRIDRDRCILALRHIVGLPPSAVAARLDVPESQVREVASAWCPADSRVDSLALLRGIDSWISADLGSAETDTTGHELDHLDDIAR